MTIDQLLEELNTRDIQLRRIGHELEVLGDDEALDESIISELSMHKAVLLSLLGRDSDDWISPAVRIVPEMLTLAELTQQEIDQVVGMVPGGTGNVQDIYALAPLQEGILFHHLMGGEGDPYLLAGLMAFDTRLTLDRYIEALQKVIVRHDILRTAVVWEGLREPVQVVCWEANLHVEEVELEEGVGDAAEQLYGRYDPRHFRIDVRQAPMLRAYIARDKKQDRWLLLLLLHHLAGDHTTLDVIGQEIQAYLLGAENRLPAALPFRNLVAQARLGLSREEHEKFFREMLGSVEEPTLPFDLVDVQGDGSNLGEARLELDRGLALRIREAAWKLRVSAASLCHVAWARVLGKVSGRDDVVFGTVLFGRMLGGVDRVLGLFINTLPVRMVIGQESVEASIRQMHKVLGDLMKHEHASLALAQRCSQVPAPAPLFSSLLNYRHSPDVPKDPNSEARKAGQGIEWLRGEERTSYPFTISVDDLGEGFALTAHTPEWVGPMKACEYMISALESLVEALELDPGQTVERVRVLPAEEWERIIYEWNQTQTDHSEKFLHELFEEQAGSTPDAIAVVFEENEISYQEINCRANQLAHHLRNLGVGPETLVGIALDRSLEMIIAVLGIFKSGGAYLPLDPEYPAKRLDFMLNDSQPSIVITTSSIQGRFPNSLRMLVLDIDETIQTLAKSPEGNLLNIHRTMPLLSDHPAYVIYTSGSTGMPKGVIVPHAGLVNLTLAQIRHFDITPESRVLMFYSLNFDSSFAKLSTAILSGAALVLAPAICLLPGPSLTALVADQQITHAGLPPAVLSVLPDDGLPGCSTITVGGELCTAELVARWSRARRMINVYGPTETTVCATMSAPLSGRSVPPIGKPIANTRVYVLDKGLEAVPAGVAGELFITGQGVARGYMNQPGVTAERFIPDPFAVSGGRLYRTGDAAAWRRDGNVEFLGRLDHQVKIRGYRIELGEIEARLAEHPKVREAVVIVREDKPGEKRLVAYYTAGKLSGHGEEETGTAASEAGLSAEDFRKYLGEKLPDYMVPGAYVRLSEMPLNPNGKLDRKRLPAPEGSAYSAQGYEPPVGEMEIAVAGIWMEVLQVERVGREDNFFALGGHSLLAVRMIARVRQAMGVETAIQDVFRHPVLSDFVHGLKGAQQSKLPDIVRTERKAKIPLSFAQQRLWFLAQMEGVSEAYHIPLGIRLSGKLDRTALRQAFDRVVARHEALRTTFVMEEDGPRQRVIPQEESHFHLLELDLTQSHDTQAELKRVIAAEARAPFDLTAGPLIRGQLIQLAEKEHGLLITMHHIVSDGWSMGVLFKELSGLYSALVRGEEDPLPELAVQYADYAVWQRKWMEGEVLGLQAEYWRKNLAGMPEVLELPADHARPEQQDFAGAVAVVALDETLTAGLKKLSERYGTTLYVTLLAGWAMLLGRLSGQQEVVIGTPTANRGRVEIENLIGFFVNTLVLRVDVSTSLEVREVLKRAGQQAIAAQQHQDIPFEQVVELVQPVRSLAHSPLFQVMFAWQDMPEGNAKLPGLEISALQSSPHVVSKFDMTLSLQEANQRIVGGLEYATALFQAETVERYLGYFRNVLEAMANDDAITVDRLPLSGPQERHQLLYQWNQGRIETPVAACIQELFEEQVRRGPNAVAVQFGDTLLSYEELNAQANRLAHYLRDLGVRPDGCVAICLERGLEMMVAILGVLKAGGAYVPLDPAYPLERLQYLLEDSAPVALVTDGSFEFQFSAPRRTLPVLDVSSPQWSNYPDTNVTSAGLAPEHAAYVIYTSGSTGRPKGVMVPHRNVTRLFTATQEWFQFDGSDIWTLFHSCAFDFSVWEIWGALLYGGRLVVVPREIARSSEDMYRLVCEEGVTVLNQTPSAFRQFVAAQADSNQNHQLRYVIFGGEELEVAGLRPWYEQNEWARTRLVNMYGITETTVHVTYRVLEPSDVERHGASPIGSQIPDLKIYILDGGGEPVPVGVVGEIYVAGAGVARGYVNRGEMTAERFVPNPYVDEKEAGERMYRTGDLGKWKSDGQIDFVGRNDLQVKVRGFRIELGEIEGRLLDYEGVKEAVVVAMEEANREKRLVAYYTIKTGESGQEADNNAHWQAEALRSYLAGRLPEYMVPAAYVRLEQLPLTMNGKLDRKGLPAPAGDAYAAQEYEAPEGEIETAVASIWAEVLQVERVGRRDNFFALGGHSLLAMQVIERMRRVRLQVDVRTLFATSTLAELAATVGHDAKPFEVPPNRIPVGCEKILPEMLPLVELTTEEIQRIANTVSGGMVNVQDIYPLAPLQEGLFFHHVMGGEGDPYIVGLQLSFSSRELLDSYIGAVQAVIARHDILRTGIVWEGLQEPVQVVWRKATMSVEEVKFATGSSDVAEQMYARFNPRRYKMDLCHAPLLRLHVAYDSIQERWVVMQMMHHIVDDHTSFGKMQEEIGAHLLGRADQLSEPRPFRDLVAQARFGVSREEHEAFFREMLGDVDEPTAPFGLLDVHRDGSGIEEERTTLDENTAKRARSRARQLKVSTASLCHVAWARVLAEISGREDVVFGTVLLGRMKGAAGADRVMGPSINTLPIKIRIAGEGAEHCVQEAHKLLADLLRHEHASLGLAQRCSGVPAPTPLFTSLLNYRHDQVTARPVSVEALPVQDGIRVLNAEERSNYPIILSVEDLGEGFGFTVQAPGWVGPKRLCEYMERALESLVEALENTPRRRVGTLRVVGDVEWLQVVHGWNQTAKALPAQECVHDLFEEQVSRTPDAVAVEYEQTTLSYGALNGRAHSLAEHLRGMNLKPEDRVAVCLDHGMESIVAQLAVLKAGATYVSLNPDDPQERLHWMLEDSSSAIVITKEDLQERFKGIAIAVLVLDATGKIAGERSRTVNSSDEKHQEVRSRHLACVIYTSSSMGKPKGVAVEHGNLMNLIAWYLDTFRLRAGECCSSMAKAGFDVSGWEVWPALCAGARLVLAPSGKMRDVVNNYGSVETTGVATSGPVEAGSAVHSIGKPIGNTQIYIVDREMEVVGVGVVGEICVGGDGVARGYVNGGGMTAERFVPDAYGAGRKGEGGRVYRTGDLGRWLGDGRIEWMGRKDDQVKIGGMRVEPGEVEVQLVEHEGVKEAVVVLGEDERGEKRLVAYYTQAEGEEEVSGEGLRSYMVAKVPGYMVPWKYVRVEEMPRKRNGKVDRKALPEAGRSGEGVGGRKEPEGEMEKVVAEIWEEVLGVEGVGREDNFFELGGRSLLAVRVIARLRERLGVEGEISEVFARPVLRDFAGAMGRAGASQLPVIRGGERGERIPLSYAQQRLWFLGQMEGVSKTYHIPLGLHMRGELKVGELRGALDRIVGRHEALRTTFAEIEGEAVQRIGKKEGSVFQLVEHDLRGYGERERAGELERLMREEAGEEFDLARGPLVRGRLIRLGEEEHGLLITMHHIVSDGWSISVFLKELKQLYGAMVRGEGDPLPELGVQYGDYAVWQRKWMEGENLRRQAEYWRKNLEGMPELLELPGDRERPKQQDYAGGMARFRLEEGLTAGLKELSQRQGTTLYMTLLAGWTALLARLSGQHDIVVGTAVANRSQIETENLIGFFVNMLAVRVDLSGSPTVREVLQRVKQQAVAAQQHQDIPFEQVVEIVQPARSLAHSPLFQVMFAWMDNAQEMLELPGLQVGHLPPAPHLVSKFDMTLSLQEKDGRIVGGLEYAASLFDASTVERYVGYLRKLLEGMVAGESQVVDRMRLLSEEEWGRVLYEWNNTAEEPSREYCAHELFEEQARKTPEAVALISEESSLSYGELNRRSNRLAHYLRTLGVTSETRVAICLERGIEMVVAELAVWKAGGTYLPLDPGFPAERMLLLLSDSGAQVLVTGRGMGVPELLAVQIVDVNDVIDKGPDENLAIEIDRNALAYIRYTSGSTGQPKGVMVKHGGLCNLALAQMRSLGVESGSRILQFAAFSFDACVWETVMALCRGAVLCFVKGAVLAGQELEQAVVRNQITHATLPSAVLATLAQEARLETLGTLILAGDVLSRTLVRPWVNGRHVINAYGPTETTVCATMHWCRKEEAGEPPIGRPITNVRVYILDAEGEPVPVGVVGEILIGGIGVARGYLNQGDITAERFVPDPYRFVADANEKETRMYRTGDLGRWSGDGQIKFIGRNDLQVKVRGFRIELGEIEERLREYEGVKDVAVVAWAEPGREKELVAYYTIEEGMRAEEEDQTGRTIRTEELRGYLAGILPQYMVPGAYVWLDKMPLTVNGKLDRERLPAPDSDAYAVHRYEAPEGEIELAVAEVWTQLLNVPRVGRHDNFFALGGHSLLAVQMTARLRQELKVKITISDVFTRPTLAALAEQILDSSLQQFDATDLAPILKLMRSSNPY